MWTPAEAEGLADLVYKSAKADPGDPPGPITLARRLRIPVQRVRRHLWGDAKLCPVGGGWVIFVATDIHPRELGFTVAHELGEWAAQQMGWRGEWVEGLADATAAAIVAPRPAYRRAAAYFGLDLQELAGAFVATQTLAALRWGEVYDVPLAVVSRREVRVRGPEAWVWPELAELRTWAKASVVPEGIERVQITDARSRAVLLAA